MSNQNSFELESTYRTLITIRDLPELCEQDIENEEEQKDLQYFSAESARHLQLAETARGEEFLLTDDSLLHFVGSVCI